MTMLSLSKSLRAAAVAIAIGGTAVTTVPAQAASPSVDFSFRFGSPGFHWEFNSDRGWDRGRRHCISDPQVRRDLRRDGYRDIRFFDRRGRVVQVTARLGQRHYEIAYDTCRQRIVDRDRIRWR